MFTIEKQPDNNYTLTCKFTTPEDSTPVFLYSITSLALSDVARFLLGRGEEDIDGEIQDIFRYTNITKAYVSDSGKVSAVRAL